MEARASYNAWMEKKKDFGKDKIREKRKEEYKKRKEEEEKYEKKREAESVAMAMSANFRWKVKAFNS